MAKELTEMEKIVSLCKKRGFIFQSSEIYGGANGCWDFGPLGVELKRNIKEYWWKTLVQYRDDVEGLDASILMHPEVWVASGHVGGFQDPMVDCKACKGRFRADQIKDSQCPKKPSKCPGEHGDCELTEPRAFNLMFKTHVGAIQNDDNIAYLRPETAQGAYVNFQNVQNPMRQKLPFGIAQIGKSFRNEINPRNFIFRTREFEQMELQFFVKPGTGDEWFEYWKKERMDWHARVFNSPENLSFYEHGEDEKAHYAQAAFDIKFMYPFSEDPEELEGVHHRGDYDLGSHSKHSGKKLDYFEEESKERYIPHVVETAVGVDRLLLALLCDAYWEDTDNERTVLKFHPIVAPVKAAVFPLVKKEGMPEIAKELTAKLRKHMPVFYDEKGAVGRRYRRMDEIGTPYCITVDGQTKEDNTVTLRERDSLEQSRVAMEELPALLSEKITI